MPTLKQKAAFDKTIANIQDGNPQTLGEILINSGYSASISKTPSAITNSKGWRQLLAEIKDDSLLKRIREIALDTDKRASLQAIDMIFKLKDRYPASKHKLQAVKEELSSIED